MIGKIIVNIIRGRQHIKRRVNAEQKHLDHAALNGFFRHIGIVGAHADMVEEASDSAKDYATTLSRAPYHRFGQGECTYCGHCKPCPADIDIALVNKYYDLYVAQQHKVQGIIMLLAGIADMVDETYTKGCWEA